MVKTIIKWTILILLLGYLAGVAVWANGQASQAVCSGIEINIDTARAPDSITKGSVARELGRLGTDAPGRPLTSIDTRAIEANLSRLPVFESVECSLDTRGALVVDVVPMVPELRVFDGDKSYYINREGKVIASKASFFVDVPVVSGHFTESYPAANLLGLCRYIQADPTLRQLVGMVHVDDPDNIMLVPRIGGHVVNFGDTARAPEKTRALLAFYRKVMPYKGWETYDTISLRFSGQVVATKRNKALPGHGALIDDAEDLEEATLPDDLHHPQTDTPT